jgi:hypothetical protein
MKNKNTPNSRRLAVFLSIALLGSFTLSGCYDMRTAVEQRVDTLPRPVVIATANAEGVLLRGANGAVIMIPPDFYMAKTIHAQGMKPGDVLVP